MLLLFIPLFFFHFRSSDLFSYSLVSSLSFSFTFFLMLFQFQPSFPHSLALLDLSLSSPCLSSSSFSTFFLFSSFPFLPILFFFLLLLLLFFISQCDDFLNFPCHFLGAVLPAPALYPSLLLRLIGSAVFGADDIELII